MMKEPHLWIVVVALKNGNVNSYRVDKHEQQKTADFWSFASERWDMLFGKLRVACNLVSY